MNFLKTSLIISTIMLTGCATLFGDDNTLNVTKTPLKREPLVLPNASPFKAKDVNWVIIKPDTVGEFFVKNPNTKVLFAIDGGDYENLAYNMLGIRNIIIQKDDIISAYKAYYEPEDVTDGVDSLTPK